MEVNTLAALRIGCPVEGMWEHLGVMSIGEKVVFLAEFHGVRAHHTCTTELTVRLLVIRKVHCW